MQLIIVEVRWAYRWFRQQKNRTNLGDIYAQYVYICLYFLGGNNINKQKYEIIKQLHQYAKEIDVLANQIGDFMRIGNLLKTDILIGTTRNVCLGLKFLENKKIYVPNT